MKERLISAAKSARRKAYSPYSKYAVGAAILDSESQIHVGCNVENVSYPVGMCAERAAIGAMVSSGSTELHMIAVATRDGGTPCGMCLQAIAEFVKTPEAVLVLAVDEQDNIREIPFRELFPFGFDSEL